MSCVKSFFLIFAVLAAVLSIAVYNLFPKKEPSPVVQLTHGQVQGVVMRSSGGREFYGYLGIPFAKPPIGSLRFKPPAPSEPWDGVFDASKQRPLCSQLDFMVSGFNAANFGSEDCLYLNVYKPKDIPKGKKLPVLAYIHGGYFHIGGTVLSAPNNFMNHDVIIVALSYRLGALGFLNTGDDVVRGNSGLKDQQFGLSWVQKNIESFGGDKSQVTLIGESAGGASVQYHMLSPGSKGLFSRAIRQSGSSLNYWTMYRNSKAQAHRFAKRFNCPTENSKAMLECLQAVDIYTLVEAHRSLMDIHPHVLMDKFVPSIETVKDADAFITEEPLDLLKSGRFNKVPILTGMARDEGLLHSTVLWANQTKLDEVDDWFSWAPRAFHYPPDRKDISKKLRDFYFGPQAKHLNSRDYIQNLTNLYGDRLFNFGIVQSAMLEKSHVPTYLYLYDHEGGFNMGTLVAASQSKIHPVFGVLAERLRFIFVTFILGQEYKHDVPGVAHADEIGLLWGGSVIENTVLSTAKDREISKDLVKLFVDFATEKKPLQFRGVNFTPSKETLNFLHINYDNPKMTDEPFQERRKFWETISLPSE